MKYSLTILILLSFAPIVCGEDEPFINETFEKYAEGQEPEGWEIAKTIPSTPKRGYLSSSEKGRMWS